MPPPNGWAELPIEQLGNLLLTAALVRKPIRYGH
jgi:hypothetical protein